MAGLLLKLLPLLSMVASASSLMQVNIDCGASSPHTDKHGIKWLADTSYIDSGEMLVVRNASTTSEEAMKTLRAFTSRKNKYCYNIDIMKGGGQILVRVSFNYGDYDGSSSPPTVELMFDANSFGAIQTSLDGEVYYEGVYVATDDMVSVCVGQSSALGGDPFVSAIQVWELDADMYPDYDKTSAALVLFKRVAYGASNDVRYPDDTYDRIWSAAAVSDSLTVLTSDATTIATNISDRPPLKVLQTAVATPDPSSFLIISTDLPATAVPAYINMYFAEPTKPSSGADGRSISIFVDGEQVEDTQTLKYARVMELYLVNATASSSTEITVRAAPGSDLPPIINALEVFGVSDWLSNGTDVADAPGLAALMSQFKELQDWGGDPCLPTSYNWDWVGCSSDDTPRITALYLSGYGLSGELPDFSSLEALEIVEMQNNSISGGIPKYLGSMPNLKELNLADNSLSGPIPSSIANNNRIKLTTDGNSKLCAAGQSCETISTPSTDPGSTTSTPSTAPGSTTKRPRTSSARKKQSSLDLMLGLAISLAFFFTIWF
ncbi:putative leucine-rich repeat receptor-like protein kinase [Iris pallida]|uniref:Leucine-rich repeat receptor-like protein kinase n=1 Tax=Iris pallida TaxID=29817 RepID=A0AAX6GIX9_IRIPA|nr:putative leucine-rich repeat receptor-like protein kinase [Iris pallida]